MAVETIYGLHIAGEPDTVFYVGRTDNIVRRLGEHRRDGSPTGTKKQRYIHAIQSRGHDIDCVVLCQGTAWELRGKEDEWIIHYTGQGIDLANDRSGDDALVVCEGGPAVPWTPELFAAATWDKGFYGCKTGESGAWVKHVKFYRQGKRKLRMEHAQYGKWQVHGSTETDRYAKACAMLTVGTRENDFLRAQAEQMRRIRGHV